MQPGMIGNRSGLGIRHVRKVNLDFLFTSLREYFRMGFNAQVHPPLWSAFFFCLFVFPEAINQLPE